jgi:polyisoprenoid-binding protein YceI
MIIYRSGLLACLLGIALGASAVALKTDPANSTVAAVFKQMNVPVEAPFTRFAAHIAYDPAKPDQASARVEIDTASLDVGDPDMNREVAKKEWFNAAQFPKASFVSSAIKPAGPGRLHVSGLLTIKGKASQVSFPLTVRQQAGKQVFEGSLPIRRLNYQIGAGDWGDTSIVADEVLIKFRITAAQ